MTGSFKIKLLVALGWPLASGHWPGGEVMVKREKNLIVFLPLIALGNESPKEFRF